MRVELFVLGFATAAAAKPPVLTYPQLPPRASRPVLGGFGLVRRWTGLGVQRLALTEVGGAPWIDPRAWAIRSPIDWARQIAFSGVPLQIWWSWKDRIVVDQNRESGALYRAIKRLDPAAPVAEFVGNWAHSAEFKATRRLPYALALFGLMPPYRAHAPGLVAPGGG